MELAPNPVNEILYISFNQDQSCFVCGTETGFRVYHTDPFRLTFRRDFEGSGGLGIVTMLFRCNILALVGGGQKPKFQPHKVMIWDDKTPRVVAELSFRSPVRAVNLRRDLIVVAIEKKVYLYKLQCLTLVDHIETMANPRGLCCLSSSLDQIVLCCLGMQKGRILVVFYAPQKVESITPQQAIHTDRPGGNPPAREKTTIIAAHEASVAAMTCSFDGTILVSASDKGTIMRVYDTLSGNLLRELRRGADRAEINCLTLSQSKAWLAVTSDKGTVHVFALKPEEDANRAANVKSSLRFIGNVLPSYFSSEWSLAQFRVPDYRSVVAFGAHQHTCVIACANGSAYKVRFNPVTGGEMVKEGFSRFDDASSNQDSAEPIEGFSELGGTAAFEEPEFLESAAIADVSEEQSEEQSTSR